MIVSRVVSQQERDVILRGLTRAGHRGIEAQYSRLESEPAYPSFLVASQRRRTNLCIYPTSLLQRLALLE